MTKEDWIILRLVKCADFNNLPDDYIKTIKYLKEKYSLKTLSKNLDLLTYEKALELGFILTDKQKQRLGIK